MSFYIAAVAAVNAILGFALAAYLGRRYRALHQATDLWPTPASAPITLPVASTAEENPASQPPL